ncbi:MAG: hypothetical protein CL489_09235 [Acidobacteria bacterium]|nr:hypothetical protein [Acidobacteriota bacterium]|tara:strand:+ start:1807 stop:2676 length:870 start_codon:yes stop_codon:yes gene_type:complete
MTSIDFAKFAAKIAKSDVGRPNLFKIQFSDVGFNITKDGVIDFSQDDIEPQGRENTESPLDGFDAIRSRVGNKIGDTLLKNSDTFRKIAGAYSPKLLRLAGGDEIVDGIMNTEPDMNKDLTLMVKSVNIPEVSYSTRKEYLDKKPFNYVEGKEQGDVTMTIICSPNLIEYQIFQSWFKAIHDPYRNAYSFYSTYARNFDIYTYKRNGRVGSLTHVQDAYPKSISEIQLDYDNNDQISTFTVTFGCSISSTISDPQIEGDLGNVFDDIEGVYDEIRGIGNNSFGGNLPPI